MEAKNAILPSFLLSTKIMGVQAAMFEYRSGVLCGRSLEIGGIVSSSGSKGRCHGTWTWISRRLCMATFDCIQRRFYDCVHICNRKSLTIPRLDSKGVARVNYALRLFDASNYGVLKV